MKITNSTSIIAPIRQTSPLLFVNLSVSWKCGKYFFRPHPRPPPLQTIAQKCATSFTQWRSSVRKRKNASSCWPKANLLLHRRSRDCSVTLSLANPLPQSTTFTRASELPLTNSLRRTVSIYTRRILGFPNTREITFIDTQLLIDMQSSTQRNRERNLLQNRSKQPLRQIELS